MKDIWKTWLSLVSWKSIADSRNVSSAWDGLQQATEQFAVKYKDKPTICSHNTEQLCHP